MRWRETLESMWEKCENTENKVIFKILRKCRRCSGYCFGRCCALPLAKALKDGGIYRAEITFRTNAAAASIRAIANAYPEMLVGAGTVLTAAQAAEAIKAGAKFIVTPGYSREVVDYCIKQNFSGYSGLHGYLYNTACACGGY